MAEAIDTAFVDIRPRFTGFAAETERGIKAQLAGASVARSLAGIDASGIKGADKATQGLGRSLSGVSAQAAGTARGLTLVGGSAARLGTLGAAGGIGLAAAIALSGKAVVAAAIDFESGVAGIRKTVDATEPVIQRIAGDLQELSTEIPVASTELLGLAESAGQLGIETQGIVEFTKTVAELGVTTNLASDVAADALARLANITQLPQDQFDNLGSTIVELGNRTASTEAEIVEFGLRISGAGHQIGLTQDQILSFGAALASMGINAEAGGSSISTVFSRIASDVAKGGKRLDLFAKTAGTSADAFAEKFRTKPAQAVVDFINGLNRITQSGGNVFQTLEDLGLGGIRIRDTLLRAAGSGDLLTRALDTGSQAWRKNNALQEEAARRFETTASNLQLAKNEVNALAADLGSVLLPSVNRLAGAFRVAVGGIRGALNTLQDAGFDAVNADLTELAGELTRIQDDIGAFGEVTNRNEAAVEGLTLAGQKLVTRIDEIGRSLNDSAAGTDKWVRIFSAASPTIQKAMQDGIITPAEKAEIQVSQLGRAFLRALPPDIFAPVAGAVRSGIEDAAAAAKAGAAEIVNNLKFGIEEGVPGAEIAAQAAGTRIGTSLATGIAQAATAAVKKSNIVGDVQDEAINAAIIGGSQQGQLAALRKKRDSLADAIEKIERIENPGKARVAQRRQLRADLAGVIQQIGGIEAGIVADQQAAQAESEQRAREIKSAREAKDRAFVEGLDDKRAGAERRVTLAESTSGLRDDIRANKQLRDIVQGQIALVRENVKDLRIQRDTINALKGIVAGLTGQIREDKRSIRENAANAAKERVAARGEGLADITQIAIARGDIEGQASALRAEIAHWSKVERAAKDGTDAQRKALLTVEQKRAELRELLKQGETDTQGLSLAGFLQQNAELFRGIASNIGQAGIDPLSGFDFGKSITAGLTRLQQAAPDFGGVQVDTAVKAAAPAGGPANAIDRLIAALDRNTEATGNAATGGSGGTKFVDRRSDASKLNAAYWRQQARQVTDDSVGGGV